MSSFTWSINNTVLFLNFVEFIVIVHLTLVCAVSTWIMKKNVTNTQKWIQFKIDSEQSQLGKWFNFNSVHASSYKPIYEPFVSWIFDTGLSGQLSVSCIFHCSIQSRCVMSRFYAPNIQLYSIAQSVYLYTKVRTCVVPDEVYLINFAYKFPYPGNVEMGSVWALKTAYQWRNFLPPWITTQTNTFCDDNNFLPINLCHLCFVQQVNSLPDIWMFPCLPSSFPHKLNEMRRRASKNGINNFPSTYHFMQI